MTKLNPHSVDAHLMKPTHHASAMTATQHGDKTSGIAAGFFHVCLTLLAVLLTACSPEGTDLVVHWKLAGDAKDATGHGHDGENHGADLSASGRTGTKAGAARFDGRDDFISVPHAAALQTGRGDFSIALWLHTTEKVDDDLGEIIGKFDPQRRNGFTLCLRNNTGVAWSQANHRQLQFGIDSGTQPRWRDEGRPGKALCAFSLATHDGVLYAGTCEPGSGESGRVYRYDGPGKWSDCGAPDGSNAVCSLAAFEGRLYAGTGKYRVSGSAQPESENQILGGKVFRYEGGGRWTDCGQLPGVEAIGGMVVFGGRLHATSLYKPAGFFRYQGGIEWEALPAPQDKRAVALGLFNGSLWAGCYDAGLVFRFDGKAWHSYPPLGDNTQTYGMAVLGGGLCVSTWPSGRVYRLSPDDTWQDLGQSGEEKETMGTVLHNGMLYTGTLPLAQVYRYDGGTTWTHTAQLDHTPEVKYRRVWTMAQHQGRLFATTLPSGHIHSLEAGACVTHDRELAPGWHHITAMRAGNRLRIFVDGTPAAESEPFDPAAFDLDNDQPLKIGSGPGDFFHGSLSDVRLYRRALGEMEIKALARDGVAKP